MSLTDETVHAVGALTARWASTVDDGTVFSAAGVWPLLGFLADGAAGAAREELAGAVGIPAGQSAAAARELLDAMGRMRGLDCALGLWTRRTVELREAWEAGLPADAHGVLTGDAKADRSALDAWAAKRTGGLVERMPVMLRPDTALVLATALALRTDWEVPFTGELAAWRGPVERAEDWAGLTRTTSDLDDVSVARACDGTVTAVRVRGTNGLDVHLLLGDERMAPGRVLSAGVDILAGGLAAVPGSRLPLGGPGPGLRVNRIRTLRPQAPSLVLDTVEFALAADHDLIARPELFGLATASDGAPGHFPGISAAPLGLRSGQQSATATFSAEGFRAAAVTTMEPVWLSAPEQQPEPEYETTVTHAVFERPFAFLAVHRATRLVLAAGWVAEPKPFREDDYDWPGTAP
ncbi:serpin family protein [Streptomyces sp. NPDC047043]|uniref:serpin family protein n=1 Tax=Streptomyces sp. NPDC047043 TaxID=3154497 RepID=UPI0033ECDE04